LTSGEPTARLSLSPPKRRALPELLADSIADGIAGGLLSPGDRIVETTVADQMGVSRVPLREALKVLHAQGILAGGDHKGFRVVSFDAEKIRQVLEVRLNLEVLLLRDAIGHWQKEPSSFQRLPEAVEVMRRAATAADLGAALRADLEFHRSISEASGNEIAATLWRAIARHVLIIFSLERRDPTSIGPLVQQHLGLVEFIQQELSRGPSTLRIRQHLIDHIFAVNAYRPEIYGSTPD
jgi:DNA-binding GntR family transcriptional regulator